MLDYIILALIFAIVINLFIQTFCKQSPNSTKEDMAPISNNQEPDYSLISGNIVNYPAQNKLFETIVNANVTANNVFHDNEKASEILDIVSDKNFEISETIENLYLGLDKYQNDFFSFDDKINHASSFAEADAVDKINLVTLNVNNLQGKTISEVYDKLTQNEFKKNMKSFDEVDVVHDTYSYIDTYEDKKVYSKNNWKYDSETVSNGGPFYDSVSADDLDFQNPLIWNNL